MRFRYLKENKGFTLVEILIVVIIIGVLVAIAIPKFVDVASNAEHSVLKYNSTHIVKIFALNIYNYKGEDRYSEIATDGLNNFLEKELEGSQADNNRDSIKNPRSRSMKILHSNLPVNNPAVFITGNSSYSYIGTGSTENLIGSIVAYINQAEPYNVQVYYVDKDGNKSVKTADFD